MSANPIENLAGRLTVDNRFQVNNRRGPFSLGQNDRSPAMHRNDNLHLSDRARAAYQNDFTSDNQMAELEGNWLDALTDFTAYAMDLNGFHRNPTGQDGYNVLAILAEKSGVDMPANINEGKYELMMALQDAWGLGDNPSKEDIYEKMGRVFGDDKSWFNPMRGAELTAESAGAPVTPAPGETTLVEEVGPAVDPGPAERPDPELEGEFLQALTDFTQYALQLNGFNREATPQDGLKALQLLAEKSGVRMPPNINVGKEGLMAAFQSEWGLGENPSAEEIFEKMVRVFGNDTSFTKSDPGIETIHMAGMGINHAAGIYTQVQQAT